MVNTQKINKEVSNKELLEKRTTNRMKKDAPRHKEIDPVKRKKRILWTITLSIFFVFMLLGGMIGFSILGGAKLQDFFNIQTWLHIFDIGNKE
jgi:uncharacterized membrane protein (DUF485 family)